MIKIRRVNENFGNEMCRKINSVEEMKLSYSENKLSQKSIDIFLKQRDIIINRISIKADYNKSGVFSGYKANLSKNDMYLISLDDYYYLVITIIDGERKAFLCDQEEGLSMLSETYFKNI
jgi:hypothetical protein